MQSESGCVSNAMESSRDTSLVQLLTTRVSSLESTIKDLRSKYKRMEATRPTVPAPSNDEIPVGDITRLRNDLDAADVEIMRLRQERRATQERYMALEQSHAALLEQARLLAAQVDKLQTVAESDRQRIHDLSVLEGESQAAIAAAHRNAQAMAVELENAQRDGKRYAREAESLARQVDMMEKQIGECHDQIHRLRSQLTTADDALMGTRARLLEAQDHIVRVNSELSQTRSRLHAAMVEQGRLASQANLNHYEFDHEKGADATRITHHDPRSEPGQEWGGSGEDPRHSIGHQSPPVGHNHGGALEEEIAVVQAMLSNCTMELGMLESELMKLPTTSGKTVEQRKRKSWVEGRILELTRQISDHRRFLRANNALPM
ncbi:Uncharacterized protein PBTT_00280 [Plasmodiophora brassicae]